MGQGSIFTGVCLSTELGGVGFLACITGHMTREGGLHPRGWVCIGGGGWADLPPGLPRGRGIRQSPRETWDTKGYDQRAGGAYPTGMHSCLFASVRGRISRVSLTPQMEIIVFMVFFGEQ